jgi:riboflavin kinase/FMN adenylyltransferase
MIVVVDLHRLPGEVYVVEEHLPSVTVQVSGTGRLVDVDEAMVAAGAGRAIGHHAELLLEWLAARRRTGPLGSEGAVVTGTADRWAGRWIPAGRLDESGTWVAAGIEWGDPGNAGYVPIIRGVVEHGDERGRELGFPTANIALVGGPCCDGVWGGWFYRQNGDRHLAAISIGTRPMFYGPGSTRLLEAHLIDFDDGLYGEAATVVLRTKLRGQGTFESVPALCLQMQRDVAAAVAWEAQVAAAGVRAA